MTCTTLLFANCGVILKFQTFIETIIGKLIYRSKVIQTEEVMAHKLIGENITFN